MRPFLTFATLLFCVFVLSGCGGQNAPAQTMLLPLPMPPVDPPDDVAKAFVLDFLRETGGPQSSSYKLARYDLNDDGRREALILFKTPYGYWCGMHGCTLLVLEAQNDGFTLVNGVQPVREPVFVSDSQTHDWHDLIVRVSGRWDEAKNVALRFDGERYPNNPANLPPHVRLGSTENARLFHDVE